MCSLHSHPSSGSLIITSALPLAADSSPPTAYTDSWSNSQSSESQVWIIDPSTSKIHPKWTNSDSSTFEDFTVSWKPYGVSRSAGTITFVTSLGAVPSYEFPIVRWDVDQSSMQLLTSLPYNRSSHLLQHKSFERLQCQGRGSGSGRRVESWVIDNDCESQ